MIRLEVLIEASDGWSAGPGVYISEDIQHWLKAHGAAFSMSCCREHLDNAVIESNLSLVKPDRLSRTVYWIEEEASFNVYD